MRNSKDTSEEAGGFHNLSDEVDRAIVARLSQNGRLSNRALARQIGVSEGTIRNRLKRLNDLGLIKVTALVNLFEDPKTMGAYVAIRLKTRDLIGVGERFSRLPGVVSVAAVAGQYDLILEVLVDSKVALIDFVTRRLPSVAEVQSAETLVILKSFNKWAVLNGPPGAPARGADFESKSLKTD